MSDVDTIEGVEMATDDGGAMDKLAETTGVDAKEAFSALRSKELLIPAALSAAGALAAAKGPAFVRKLSGESGDAAAKLGERAAAGAKDALGASMGLPGKAMKKAVGKDGEDGKKTRRLPIERWTDVAVPVERAYAAWNDFEQFPSFMHRVLRVEQRDDDVVSWDEKIWFSTREWEGYITDRRENDRIAWITTKGMSHRGVVSFHRIGENLTRVMVTMEFVPQGVLEKMASGLRFVKRAVESDLARFKAFVEMEDARGLKYRPATDGDGSDARSRRSSRDDASRDEEREERRGRREQRREALVGN